MCHGSRIIVPGRRVEASGSADWVATKEWRLIGRSMLGGDWVTQVVRSTNDGHVQLVTDANGRYAVKVAEQVVFKSRVLTAAEIYYTEEVDKHRAVKRDILARERAHFDAQAL